LWGTCQTLDQVVVVVIIYSISSILAAIGLDSQAKAGDRISCKRLGLKTAKIVEAIKMKVSLGFVIQENRKGGCLGFAITDEKESKYRIGFLR